MIDLAKDIHSLTDFKRKTGDFLQRMKKSGHPLVLTVNGRAALIVQDPAAYQRMLASIDRAEAIAGIRRGLESMTRGQGRPAEEVFEGLRKKYKIPRKA